jgi:FMN phosphatase YigB (HAD superfamily)
MSSIECVCFDLGGVLVRIARDWSEGCRLAGFEVRGGSAGSGAGRLRGELMHQFGIGRLGEAEWAERVERAMDGLYTREEVTRIHHCWTRGEYSGALELVEELNARGVVTACLSNTNHAHWKRLVHHDGEKALFGEPEYPAVTRLRHAHASHLHGLAKPDPAFYREFEAKTGHRGKAVLFFDDLIENVEAARSIGWRAERVEPTVETVPQIRALLTTYGVL